MPATSSPSHLIVFSTLPCLLSSSSSLPPLLASSHLSYHSPPISDGLPRFLCPAHCSPLLTNLSLKLLCTPVSSPNSIILLLSALVTLAKQPNQQSNSWVEAATSGFCGSLPLRLHCFKELHQVVRYNNILLRNRYHAYY